MNYLKILPSIGQIASATAAIASYRPQTVQATNDVRYFALITVNEDETFERVAR